MTNREREVENELSDIVGRHADWLDGPTLMRLCEQVTRGYFNDLPEPATFMAAVVADARQELGLSTHDAGDRAP